MQVPLRLNQIQYLQENKIPEDLSPTLVFYNGGLAQLRRRIKELQQEKLDIKKQHRELKKQHVLFNKSKKEKQSRVQELQEKARDVQMLKFGQLVDLEKLEKLGSNKAADELRDKIHKDDVRRSREVAELERQIKEQKNQLMQVMQQNTLNLERIVSLQEQKQFLEKNLNQSQRSVNAEISGPPEKEVEEREKLIQLVQNQAQQIETIKAEIENLIRKPTNKTYTYGKSKQFETVPPPAEEPVQQIVEPESEAIVSFNDN
jgi:chromosome segregation ATPase